MLLKKKNQKNKVVKKDTRPSWDEYFMRAAFLICERSTCLRRKVGAILVKDRQILATGYNGAPKNITHCQITGCLREKLGVPSGQRHEICRGLHAEQNVILQAASFGISTKGSTLYITNAPCSICAKMIINAGIEEVIIKSEYPDKMAIEFLKEAGVILRKIKEK